MCIKIGKKKKQFYGCVDSLCRTPIHSHSNEKWNKMDVNMHYSIYMNMTKPPVSLSRDEMKERTMHFRVCATIRDITVAFIFTSHNARVGHMQLKWHTKNQINILIWFFLHLLRNSIRRHYEIGFIVCSKTVSIDVKRIWLSEFGQSKVT